MSRTADFESLRARTMGLGADEEAVTVNTRALIDKVLARYSGEWTVLRELLQNAADANAKTVRVKFESLPSTTAPAPTDTDPTAHIKHVITQHTLKSLIVSNDGVPFSDNDWARLKRIAEGNPDETKIGAFGVGFYSVFSDCEEPFVSSGSGAMAFYWKGNALYTRRMDMPVEDISPETNFVLPYRNTSSPVPPLIPLCQFLASSLTFAGLQTIELWLDDWRLLSLKKKTAPGLEVTLPRTVETRTKNGLLKVSSVRRRIAQIDAVVMKAVSWTSTTSQARAEGVDLAETARTLRSFFQKLTRSTVDSERQRAASDSDSGKRDEDLTAAITSSVFFSIIDAQLKSSVPTSLSQELQRATKKPPPRTTTLAILTPIYNPPDSSSVASGSDNGFDIFASVLPTRGGRIFIGFTTHQTTGLNAHVSAPSLIPTVERESIDLNARYVRDWNFEILRAVGIVCRVAWGTEMADLKYKLPPRSIGGITRADAAEVAHHLPEAAFISNQYVFRESTPSPRIGESVEDAFWTCDRSGYFEVLSSCGVLPTSQVRVAPKDLSFMAGIPVIPDELAKDASQFVRKLLDFGLITEITIRDIKRALENNALSSKQLAEFLRWACDKVVSGEYDAQTMQSLFAVAIANEEDSEGRPQGLLALGEIRCFLNPARIPADMPLPPYTIPFAHTRNLPLKSLTALGWHELELGNWVQWLLRNAAVRSVLSQEHDLTTNAAFAARVLPVLSRQLDTLGPIGRSALVDMLKDYTVIPTRAGMRKPADSYFPSVRLFDDLPVVTGLTAVMDRFLATLGVRKTVDLNVIFERLVANQPAVDGKKRPRWSHVELVKYFTSVWSDIPQNDILRLKGTRFCSKEPNGNLDQDQSRYRAADLYEPDPQVIELGFPVLQWPGQYNRTSQEGKFLTSLGLRQWPSAADLIDVMANAASRNDLRMRDKALAYFLTHYLSHGYAAFDISRVNSPFLPLDGSNHLATPAACFTDGNSRLLGFDILRKDLHGNASRLGVKAQPALSACLARFSAKLPQSRSEARTYFEYFYRRLGDLDAATASKTGHTAIVPVRRPHPTLKESQLMFLPPVECFVGENEEYAGLFDFVDFGPEGNMFLMACGSKREPTKVEVAQLLVKEPGRILAKLQTPERYLTLLRHIAENITLLRKNTQIFSEMKRAKFLLGSKEVAKPLSDKDEEATLVSADELGELDNENVKEYELTRASDAVVIDDYSSFSIFRASLIAVPQEEALEELYLSLGAPYLSSLVDARSRRGAILTQQDSAVRLRRQILERARLFLYDQPRDAVKHDARWLEKNLVVQNVSGIEYIRVLRGRGLQHVEKRSAIAFMQGQEAVLSIAQARTDYYQISQSLAQLILHRPKLSATLTFEMILKTGLLELRARGYNVERILRAKAAEARIAETQRLEQLEQEREQALQREKAMTLASSQQAAPQPPESQRAASAVTSMPGEFPSQEPAGVSSSKGSQAAGTATADRHRSKGFLSDLTERFRGMTAPTHSTGAGGGLQTQLQSGSQSQQAASQATTGGSSSQPQDPGAVRDNLASAINKCRPYGSQSLYSRGEVKELAETKFYCDEKPSQNLVIAGTVTPGMKVFTTHDDPGRSDLVQRQGVGLRVFASVLNDCAQVFRLQISNVHIFDDASSKAIAFNSSGSIFCNYHYFEQLHASSILHQGQGYDRALVYWWVVFCHELAHNIVQDHSSQHSFYTENFVSEYFPGMMQMVLEARQRGTSLA